MNRWMGHSECTVICCSLTAQHGDDQLCTTSWIQAYVVHHRPAQGDLCPWEVGVTPGINIVFLLLATNMQIKVHNVVLFCSVHFGSAQRSFVPIRWCTGRFCMFVINFFMMYNAVLSVSVGLWNLRCALPHRYRTMLCTTDLRCCALPRWHRTTFRMSPLFLNQIMFKCYMLNPSFILSSYDMVLLIYPSHFS